MPFSPAGERLVTVSRDEIEQTLSVLGAGEDAGIIRFQQRSAILSYRVF